MIITCTHCNGEIEIQAPAIARRGKLQGLDVAAMTDDQLRVELINSKSVLSKAVKRGAAQETIDIATARVEAAVTERGTRPTMAVAVALTDEEKLAIKEAKEVEKAEKKALKEAEKAEKKALKEAEKAEKKALKEAEKLAEVETETITEDIFIEEVL